ncbi:ABC transporter, solute-binding domain protein [Bordetella bronchiseptica E012]|nr:ABC transporter, solute-binding domain protein [Bordetella bronchiseptica E012]
MRSQRLALTFAAVMAAFAGASAHAATEIQFWHSMEGALGDRVNGLVEEFNKQNADYQIKAVYKGNYGESMNAGIAAFRAGNAPDILQVFEVGTATMMYAKGAIKPVQQMSEEVGDPIDPKQFIGAVAGYYSSPEGKLVSMPFNSSTVVFYYNKDAFLTSQVQPEPKLPAADLLKASLKASTLPHLALMASASAPVGSPPPLGDRLFQ